MEKYAVIMAGGTGSRLWPLSREKKPKQFIVIEENKSMLIKTVERICAIVPPEKCFIITNKNLLEITQNTLTGIIPLSNIITEPARRNTAACIAYATLFLEKTFGAGLLCFIPADGYVMNHDAYGAALNRAFQTAEKSAELVIIGIKPTYPATGYGYIHIGRRTDEHVYKVSRFVEKPDPETAQRLLESQEYLWNSGILVGKTDSITAGVAEFLPEHYRLLTEAMDHMDEHNPAVYLEAAFPQIPDISFDNGVLEKSRSISVVEGEFDWDDIGSLDALAKTFLPDEDGNFIKGCHLGIDTANSVIYSEDALVTTISVENMLVAAVDDAILICRRDKVQDIKALVALLKKRGYEQLL